MPAFRQRHGQVAQMLRGGNDIGIKRLVKQKNFQTSNGLNGSGSNKATMKVYKHSGGWALAPVWTERRFRFGLSRNRALQLLADVVIGDPPSTI